MSDNTLSVIMPCYNHAQYVGEALEAILSQSFKPLEVIVVDDGSTDNSAEIIQEFVRREPTVRLLRNEQNMGAALAGNRAREIASGDYMYNAAADDKVLPGFFEKTMNLLSAYPQAGLCSGNTISIDEQGKTLSELKYDAIREPCYIEPTGVLANLRRNPDYIMHVSVVYKRSVLMEAGGIIPELGFLRDWFIQRIIALTYGGCFIPEPLACWRQSESQGIWITFRQADVTKDIYAHALYLMTTKYSEVLPKEFVSLCRRYFTNRLKQSLRAQLRYRQSAFLDELPNLKSQQRATDRLLLYCLRQFSRIQRLLASYYCHRDFASELEEALNRLRSADKEES